MNTETIHLDVEGMATTNANPADFLGSETTVQSHNALFALSLSQLNNTPESPPRRAHSTMEHFKRFGLVTV